MWCAGPVYKDLSIKEIMEHERSEEVNVVDFDGVLSHTQIPVGMWIFDKAEEEGYTIPTHAFGRRIKGPEDIFPTTRHGMGFVLEDLGFPPECIPRLVAKYEAEIPSYGFPVYPGVLDAIRWSGIPSGIVTTNFKSVVDGFLVTTRSADIFPVVVGAREVARQKPDPEGAELCLRLLGKGPLPRRVNVIGDGPQDLQMSVNLERSVKARNPEVPFEVRAIAVAGPADHEGRPMWGHYGLDRLSGLPRYATVGNAEELALVLAGK